MKSKTKRLIALILGASLVFGSSVFVFADTDFLSSGRFEYKTDPSATDPDVILDSRDLSTIYTEVKDGKIALATKINTLTEEDTVSADINNLPTFEELADAMDIVHQHGYNAACDEAIDKLLNMQVTIAIPVQNDIFDNPWTNGTFYIYYGQAGPGATTWSGNCGSSSGSYGTTTRITSATFAITGKNKYTCTVNCIMEESAWADGYENYSNPKSFSFVTTYDNGTVTCNGGSVHGNNNDHDFRVNGTPTWTVPDWE